jgi:hypothetical protein
VAGTHEVLGKHPVIKSRDCCETRKEGRSEGTQADGLWKVAFDFLALGLLDLIFLSHLLPASISIS